MNTGIYYYSFFNTLAYATAALIFYAEAKRKRYPLDILTYILAGSLLGALIGSKGGSALFVYNHYYAQHPLDILAPQIGGKTLVGGLIGGYIGTVLAKRFLKFKRSTGDLFAPGVALGIAIGRIGCFFNGCCYGVTTRLPWGVESHGAIRHPTQIYESLFCFALFLFLWTTRVRINKEGDLFKLFLIGYCFFRFWIEFLRDDVVRTGAYLSMAQFISAAVVVFLLWFFVKQHLLQKEKTCQKA